MKLFIIILIMIAFPGFAMCQQGRGIQKIFPHEAIVQFAGNAGLGAAGIGYETNNKKLSGAVLYGLVPKNVSSVSIHSITAKVTWQPLQFVSRKISVNYLNLGIYGNYVFGKQYFSFVPEFYPYRYYGFPSAINTGLFVGQSIDKNRFSLYYEIGSTGKELISYLGNMRSVEIIDILALGVGVKYDLQIQK
ncbi:hypothetical protein BH20BAC1_BH20BAC1_17980 [soil metagenome]